MHGRLTSDYRLQTIDIVGLPLRAADVHVPVAKAIGALLAAPGAGAHFFPAYTMNMAAAANAESILIAAGRTGWEAFQFFGADAVLWLLIT